MTLEEMKEFLPDYALGKLDQDAASDYEKKLEDYPELIKEIEEIKLAFSKMNKLSYDEMLDFRTRNLSVKVNERISKQTKSTFVNSLIIRFGVPALVIVVIMIFVFNGSDESSKVNQNTSFSQNLQSALVFENIDEESFSDYEYLSMIIPDIDNKNTDLVGSQILSELYTEDADEKLVLLMKVSSDVISPGILNDEIEELTEEEFQLLLEEIKNVQI